MNRFGRGGLGSTEQNPEVPLVIEAPFESESPVADGRIEPSEYPSSLSVVFASQQNPGRLTDLLARQSDTRAWIDTTKSDPADLSYRVYALHNSSSLFLAFEVRDQFIDDQSLLRTALARTQMIAWSSLSTAILPRMTL